MKIKKIRERRLFFPTRKEIFEKGEKMMWRKNPEPTSTTKKKKKTRQ